MVLRELRLKDIEGMLEWMKDEDISNNFKFDSSKVTNKDAKHFIIKAAGDTRNRHFAIVNEIDEYMGTISLKKIDFMNHNAEYAIVTRKLTHGSGIAMKATNELFNKAFSEMNLHKIYLNVLANNKRAIRFYEKAGFVLEGKSREALFLPKQMEEYCDLCWYGILKHEFFRVEEST